MCYNGSLSAKMKYILYVICCLDFLYEEFKIGCLLVLRSCSVWLLYLLKEEERLMKQYIFVIIQTNYNAQLYLFRYFLMFRSSECDDDDRVKLSNKTEQVS